MIYNMTEDGSNYETVEEGEDIVKTLEKIKPRGGTVYMLESGDFIGVDSCPACGKEATVEYYAGYGYTCSCNNFKCHMSGNMASYFPTAFAAINNWNGLTLAIDISRAKGGVDESDMSRIFGPIPDDSIFSDESGSESE